VPARGQTGAAARDEPMKTCLTVIACWAALVGWAAAPPAFAAEAAVIDRIVAVVNEDIISQYDIETLYRPLAENIKTQRMPPEMEKQALERLRGEILENLIETKLTDQEIKRYSITVKDEEIDNYIRQIKEKRSLSDQGLQNMLASQGMTMEEYRKEIKAQIQRSRLVNREVKSKVVITAEEIKTYYERNRATYGGGKKYHLWNLLVKLPRNPSPSEKQNAEAILKEAQEEIKKGRSFQDLTRIATNESRGVMGSDLGFFRAEELTPQLRDAVKAMKPGDVSPMVETEFGYQLIYVEEIQDSPARPMAEVEAEIQDVLYREYVEDRFRSWLSELRQRSAIRIIEP
jgi:peptidyl-prolyl cis-trans isomerase SurA